MLFHLFYHRATRVEHVVFSDVMPRLRDGSADFGVCIHEGRFTWQDEGLSLVEDSGTRWEREMRVPLPLGGLLARRTLREAQLAAVQAIVQESLQLAIADPASALPQMRRHAQAFDDQVLMQHVDLYVNDWTVDLGQPGRRALAALSPRRQGERLDERGAGGFWRSGRFRRTSGSRQDFRARVWPKLLASSATFQTAKKPVSQSLADGFGRER